MLGIVLILLGVLQFVRVFTMLPVSQTEASPIQTDVNTNNPAVEESLRRARDASRQASERLDAMLGRNRRGTILLGSIEIIAGFVFMLGSKPIGHLLCSGIENSP
jgi:uncharacterized membrane protein HdeD (DUF308 family)